MQREMSISTVIGPSLLYLLATYWLTFKTASPDVPEEGVLFLRSGFLYFHVWHWQRLSTQQHYNKNLLSASLISDNEVNALLALCHKNPMS